MRQKRIGPGRHGPAEDQAEPFDVDVGATARQVALSESGSGVPHGVTAILFAFVTAVALTGARALWRAFTRVPPGRR